jgi:hypothetical protein
MATYRGATHYAHVEPEGIPGSPDRASDAALHEAAWRIVEPRFRQALEAELDRLGAALGNGGASVVLADVLRAAHEGRVETLFLADGADVWGTYDPATGDVAYADGPGPEAEVLTDLAAARTTGAGGAVYVVAPDRLPDGAAAAALLRY